MAPVQETAMAPVRETAMAPVQETAMAPVQETAMAPVRETAMAPVRETAMAPVRETAMAPVQETAKAPVQETAMAPVRETAMVQEHGAGAGAGAGAPPTGAADVSVLLLPPQADMISEQSSALAAVVRDLGCCDVLMERSCGVNVGVGAEPLVEQGWLQSSFDISSVALIGCEKKVVKLPRLRSIARRKFSSSIGPRMNPSISGAGSSDRRMKHVADQAERRRDEDVVQVVVDAERADAAEEQNRREQHAVGNLEDREPEPHQRHVQDQQEAVADPHAGDQAPEQVGMAWRSCSGPAECP
jgi:hypothetical protein